MPGALMTILVGLLTGHGDCSRRSKYFQQWSDVQQSNLTIVACPQQSVKPPSSSESHMQHSDTNVALWQVGSQWLLQAG